MAARSKKAPPASRCECCGRTLGMKALVERIIRDGYADAAGICDRARNYIPRATNRQVYNALTSLTRDGRVQHKGYGSYTHKGGG